MESLQNFYDLKIEHIRDDIDVRTESLICDLQVLREEYFKKLDDVKLKIQALELNPTHILFCFIVFSFIYCIDT